MERFDRDHLLWTQSQWSSSPLAESIRTEPTLIARLDRRTHEEKHKYTPPIPLLGHYALQRVRANYVPGSTPLESIDHLIMAINTAKSLPKAHQVEKELADLVMHSLTLAKPYWAESPDQPSPRRYL